DVLSGVIAVTPLSPVVSWSRSGRLVFTYFENGGYGTYVVEDPLALPRIPVARPAVVAVAPPGNVDVPASPPAAPAAAPVVPGPDAGPLRPGLVSSYYRAADGSFRVSAERVAVPGDAPAPVSVVALL